MSDDFDDIPTPVASNAVLSVDEAVHGPLIPPQQQIVLYSPEQWEGFIHEWAHFCLKKQYLLVRRFTGAGDRGVDVAGFTDAQKLQGVWDNYQCKHYDDALTPTDVWPEIGKIIWYSFNKEYRAPRRCCFVAPFGAGTKLTGYFGDVAKLKAQFIENWDKYVRNNVTDKQELALEGELLAYVNQFDFSIFDATTSLQIIEDHKQCPFHAARFGGGLQPRPESAPPPAEIAASESRYIAQLLGAYADHAKQDVPDVATLKSMPKLHGHFTRSREAFYQAEGLRVFARDTVPPGTFESLQEDIYTGVIDTHDASHPDAFKRVCEVTQAARNLQLTSNALLTRTKPKDRDGICHQLANEDRLKWTE